MSRATYAPRAANRRTSSSGPARSGSRSVDLPSSGYAGQVVALKPDSHGYEVGDAARKPADPVMVADVGSGAIPPQYADKSQAWKLGFGHGVSQARGGLRNIGGDAMTRDALQNASTQTGVGYDDLSAMAIIESTGNRHVGTNRSGFTGLMQMGDTAAQDLGMSFSGMQGGANVRNNALAGAKYWQLNDDRLDEDIPRDPTHMYLAHQQGAGGVNQLMKGLKSNPDAGASRNQRNNLPPGVARALGRAPTRQDFYDYWTGKMTAIQDAIAEQKNRRADA